MPLLGNTGKRGFAYIPVPEHVVKVLLKLNGIEFNERKLVFEKAKTPPKKTTGKKRQAFMQTHSLAIDFEMETSDKSRSKDSNDLNGLPENIIKVGKICQNHNIGEIFISGIIPSTLTNVDICDINKKRLLCKQIILSLLNIHR